MIFDKKEFLSLLTDTFGANQMSELIDADKADAFFELTVRMLEENKKYNLTAITDIPRVVLNHYADSAAMAFYVERGARVVDIGCGAGFPTLPLAIIRPDLEIVAVDSTAKRIAYVNETARLLGLKNVTAIAMRAEDGGQNPTYRESFDVCTARAVAQMRILCELCLPYVKVGGKMIAMKGPSAERENAEAEGAIARLGGVIASCENIRLVGDGEELNHPLVFVEKRRPTPREFPRPYAKILKKPL